MPNSLPWNILMLVVYGIGVAWTFYQMWADLDEFVSFTFDSQAFEQQLEPLELTGLIGVSFKFKDLYKPPEFRELEITVENKTTTRSLFILWERCTLASLKEESLRVIRVIPGMSLDLSQSQTFTFIAPGQKTTEKVTVEKSLKPNEKGELAIAEPIFKPKDLGKAAKENKGFSLRLIVEMTAPAVGVHRGSLHALTCPFIISKTPKRRSLYWEAKVKKKKKEIVC